MKLFGHPVHVMLIHFPSALFPMDVVCSFLGFYYGNSTFANASFFAMVGGVGLGALAILTGTMDLLNVIKEKPGAVSKVLMHGVINTCVVIIYSVLALIAFKHYPELKPDGLSQILFKVFLNIFMIAGNYMGGSLILKDKIGIEN